jgi:hypothetical protein
MLEEQDHIELGCQFELQSIYSPPGTYVRTRVNIPSSHDNFISTYGCDFGFQIWNENEIKLKVSSGFIYIVGVSYMITKTKLFNPDVNEDTKPKKNMICVLIYFDT